MHGVDMLFLLFTVAIVLTHCVLCYDDTKEGKQQLLKFQIPLGLGSEQLLETDPATRNVYFNGTVTGDTAAVLIGGAGLLAVAAPALYIAYLSRSTGQSAVSIAKVIFLLTYNNIISLRVLSRDISGV